MISGYILRQPYACHVLCRVLLSNVKSLYLTSAYIFIIICVVGVVFVMRMDIDNIAFNF